MTISLFNVDLCCGCGSDSLDRFKRCLPVAMIFDVSIIIACKKSFPYITVISGITNVAIGVYSHLHNVHFMAESFKNKMQDKEFRSFLQSSLEKGTLVHRVNIMKKKALENLNKENASIFCMFGWNREHAINLIENISNDLMDRGKKEAMRRKRLGIKNQNDSCKLF